jgi:ATP/maltotriose-dependent transcriptional regulator MalT
MARTHSIPIIHAKLHRPPVCVDFVRRERLNVLPVKSTDHPLILVSAPAGYGKSSIISHWLETHDSPIAWLSLDEADGDVRVFLSYLVAAVQTVFPEACTETLAQLDADGLEPLPVLAGSLSNDFDDFEQSLVLVLDDYHLIKAPAVHELLNHLLLHPPHHLRLVIISRYDPPLELGALRAHNSLTEIRMQDLKFKLSETTAFFEQTSERAFSRADIALLHDSTEGWVAGLRLASLALKHHSDPDVLFAGFSGKLSTVQDYLVEEVLALQLPAARDCLRRTSILSRFCAPLCAAICITPSNADAQVDTNFIQFLEASGMLCVALDDQGEWYRYHHLFQELLQRQLKARLAPDEITGLHRCAAGWFEAQGLLEEAMHHTLQGDGPAEASRLIVRHRNDILNGEQWHRLALWLNRLPAEVVEDDPDLLMLRAWHLQNRGRHVEAFSVLDRIGEIVSREPWKSTANTPLEGAMDALRGHQHYINGQADLAIQCAEQALMRLPPDCLSERGYAIIVLGAALRTSGDPEGARKVIYDALADTLVPAGTFQGRLLMVLSALNWVTADLPAMRLAAKQYLELGEKFGLAESIMNARYFLGCAQYHQNELAQAEMSLLPVVSERRVPNLQYFTESAFALASVYQARGQADQARETVESLCERLLRARNTTLLQRAQAYQADLALRQGRLAEAVNWEQGFDPEPFQNMYRFHEPRMTLARVLITEGSTQSLERAASLLTRLETFLAGIHDTRFLIEVLALQALLHDARGDGPAALKALSRAVSLARPGGFIRLFVDLGPGLVRLLHRLDLDAEGKRYVGRILDAYRSDGKAQADETLEHPLTKRELEILELLAKELSNKQIADQLFIAPATVKRHSENIYHKLDVPGRHQAVAKAKGLAIIHTG